MKKIVIIGGGLAGSEAAYQIASRGGAAVEVELHEMKPHKYSEAHRMEGLAELVCSNSLKATNEENSSGLLKAEMALLDSLIIDAAYATRVPAGGALAVDREKFSEYVSKKLLEMGIKIIRGEVNKLPTDRPLIIATGPLTTDKLGAEIEGLLGSGNLFFYDAVAPVVYFDSIDMDKAFKGSRYGRSGDDYINCPMNQESYERFVSELTEASLAPMKEFEENKYFEGCLPIEVMAKRGIMTLSFGPLKPVGLENPHDDRPPYAVVQLRRENSIDTLYNLVGFQTRLTYGEQKRVFRMIPALENAEFARLGKMHRNSYIDSPRLLSSSQSLRTKAGIFFAGQLTGVEGYVESSASGLMAGINALRGLYGLEATTPPETTMTGALLRYISNESTGAFQPMNANFGLLPPLKVKAKKKERKRLYAERGLRDMEKYIKDLNL